MKNIFEFYKDILSTANLTVDKDNMISATMKGTSLPFMVDSKRLVLPTKEHLLDSGTKDKIMFHPLSESVMRGESKVMERFRGAINTKLNFVLGSLMEELMILLTSHGEHAKLTPDQSSLLYKVKEPDVKTLDVLRNLLKTIGLSDINKCIVHIYLKKGGIVNGKTFNRAAIVSFPLYTELLKKEKQIFGIALRNKDRDAIISLLEYIIPGIDTEGSFNRGSVCDIAPFLDALMKSLMGVAGRINDVVNNFTGFIQEPESYLYSDGWVETFDNLSQMLPEIRAIPMQAGNEGSVINKNKPPINTAAMLTLAQPVNNVPMQQQTLQTNTMFNTQPMQPQVQQHINTPVVTANGGLDFSATLRANPGLAAMVAGPGHGVGMFGAGPSMVGPAALRAGIPPWAQPSMPVYNTNNYNPNFAQPMQQQFRPGFGSI